MCETTEFACILLFSGRMQFCIHVPTILKTMAHDLLTGSQKQTNIVNPWQPQHTKYPHNINTFDQAQLFPTVVSAQGITHSGNPGSVKELFILTLLHWRTVCVCLTNVQGLKPEHMEEDLNSVNKWEPCEIPWNFIMHVHIKVLPLGDSGEK